MPQIPLYEQQVRISDEQAGVKYDASAEIEGLRQQEQTGKIIADFGEAFQAKYDKLEREAAEADYEVQLNKFKNDLKERKAEAMQNGTHFADIESQVIQPEIDNFRSQLMSRSYPKSSMNRFAQRFALEEQDLISGERLDRLKLQASEHVTSIKELAFSQMRGTNEQYQQGIDSINNLQQSGYITKEQSMQFIDEGTQAMLKSNISGIIDLEELDEIKTSDKYNSLSSFGKAEIDGAIAARKSQVTSEIYSVETNALETALRKKRLTVDAIDRSNLPEALKQTYRSELEKERSIQESEYKIDPVIDLDELGTRIQNFFLGEFKGSSKKEFESIWQEINSPENGIPPLVRNNLNDILIDTMSNPNENELMWSDTPFAQAFIPEVRDAFALLADQYDEATANMPASIADEQFLEAWQSLYNYAIDGQRQLKDSAELETPARTGRARIRKYQEEQRLKSEMQIDLSPEGLRKQVNVALSNVRKNQANFIFNKKLGIIQIGQQTDFEIEDEVNQTIQAEG